MWNQIECFPHDFTIGRQTMLNVSKHVSQWYRKKITPHNRTKYYLLQAQKGMLKRKTRERKQSKNTSLPKIVNSSQNEEYYRKVDQLKEKKEQSRNEMEQNQRNIQKHKNLTQRVDNFIRQRKRQIQMKIQIKKQMRHRPQKSFATQTNTPPKQIYKGHVKLIKGTTYSELNQAIIQQMRSIYLASESNHSQLKDLRRKRLGVRK